MRLLAPTGDAAHVLGDDDFLRALDAVAAEAAGRGGAGAPRTQNVLSDFAIDRHKYQSAAEEDDAALALLLDGAPPAPAAAPMDDFADML